MKDFSNMHQLDTMPTLGEKASLWCKYDSEFRISAFYFYIPGRKKDLIKVEQQEIMDLLLDTFATDETINRIRDFEIDEVGYDDPLTLSNTGCVRSVA